MEFNKTITSIFMLPTLKIGREALQDNNCINAYIKDGEREENYENAIYVLFKPKNLDKFREFLDNEYERNTILDDYDYPGGYVIVVYKLDDRFKEDFQLIRKGKYSKTSYKFQELFPKVIKIMKNGLHKDELSLQFRIFNKTPDLIEFWEEKFGITFGTNQEIWNGFLEEEETFNISKIKEYV